MSARRDRHKQRQPAPQSVNPAPEKLRQIVQREILTLAAFSGPLPPPEILVKYNDAAPNGAERIIAMAERQAGHRMALESRVVDADIKRANWGLAAGFVVALAGLLVAYLLIDRGNAVAGMAFGTIDLVGLVAVFIYGTLSRRSERQQRAKMMSGGS